MKKPIVAIMYDFDKTLITRDMQEYTFIPSLGMQPDDFWDGTQTLASEQQMDSVLAYMYAMMIRAEANGKPLKREDLVECGQHVVYLPGVEGWFERINGYGKEAGVEVEHYVLSSGLKEIIDGTSIAKHFIREQLITLRRMQNTKIKTSPFLTCFPYRRSPSTQV